MTAKTLTQDRLKELLHYDPETGVFTRRITVCPVARAGVVAGSPQGEGYLSVMISGANYQLHQLAFLYMTGCKPDYVDHINKVRDDNRWFNLRPATHAINSKNQKMHSRNVSGVTGVYRHKNTEKWTARITTEGRYLYLGMFNSLSDAAAARISAERKYGFHPTHGTPL